MCIYICILYINYIEIYLFMYVMSVHMCINAYTCLFSYDMERFPDRAGFAARHVAALQGLGLYRSEDFRLGSLPVTHIKQPSRPNGFSDHSSFVDCFGIWHRQLCMLRLFEHLGQ